MYIKIDKSRELIWDTQRESKTCVLIMMGRNFFHAHLIGTSGDKFWKVNLVGALKQAMATTGYSDLKELQRIEVVVNSIKG